MKEIKINTDFIKLQQLLKLANFVSQGSDAKMFILDGKVSVNGEVILQRGKKIFNGDVVQFKNQEPIKVISNL